MHVVFSVWLMSSWLKGGRVVHGPVRVSSYTPNGFSFSAVTGMVLCLCMIGWSFLCMAELCMHGLFLCSFALLGWESGCALYRLGFVSDYMSWFLHGNDGLLVSPVVLQSS